MAKTAQHIHSDLDPVDWTQAEKAGCSYEDKTITFAFRVQPWQVNRAGHLHGGMMCTAFDMTMGVLVRFLAGKNFTPTVSLDKIYTSVKRRGM